MFSCQIILPEFFCTPANDAERTDSSFFVAIELGFCVQNFKKFASKTRKKLLAANCSPTIFDHLNCNSLFNWTCTHARHHTHACTHTHTHTHACIQTHTHSKPLRCSHPHTHPHIHAHPWHLSMLLGSLTHKIRFKL